MDASPRSLYYAIKSARREAKDDERDSKAHIQGAKAPDWAGLRDICVKALAEKSKDLELTAYLVESLSRLNAVAGIRDGFRLIREFVERYWSDLYPSISEDDPESLADRITIISGLFTGVLNDPIRQVVLTKSVHLGEFNYAQHIDAVYLAGKADNSALASLKAAAADTPAEFYQTLVADLKECAEEFNRLVATVDNVAGGEGVAGSKFRAELEALLKAATTLAGDKLTAATGTGSGSTTTSTSTPDAPRPEGPNVNLSDVIRSREEALEGLLKVADFFRRTEPHTVISYTLEQVVRWGKMPLPELLKELITDPGIRAGLFKQVGIPNEESPPPE